MKARGRFIRPGEHHARGQREAGARVIRLLGLGIGIHMLLILMPTMVTYVNPGHVGIVIHRTGGGVGQTPLGPGLHLRNPLTTGIQKHPT